MGFSGQPSEPDVRLSPHPALHVLMPLECLTRASGSARPGNDIARWRYRPLVQLCLHREYPRLGLDQAGPRSAGIHQRPPRRASALRAHWTPLPCTRLSRARTTTGPPPHFAGVDRRQVFPAMMAGTDEVVPTFTLEPFNGVGAQLCPCNFAMAMPQSFTVASRPATSPSQGVLQPVGPVGCALLPSPDLSGSSWWFLLEGLSDAGSSRTPFRLACRTRTI